MQKISFYLLPCKNYNNIKDTDVVRFGDTVQKILLEDLFIIPYEFYSAEDNDGIKAYDFLYGTGQTDISRYLLEIISKQKIYEETYRDIEDVDLKGYAAILAEDINEITKDISAMDVGDIPMVKRYYLKRVNNYEDYIDMMEACFPKLIFHENVYHHIKKLGKFETIKDELTRHLIVLNDYARMIYLECDGKEENTFNELKAKHNIICSGKGSNEDIPFKLKYGIYDITCNPHTKLFTKYSDQRIYFCWGRNEIKDHQIIIARIGDHWN